MEAATLLKSYSMEYVWTFLLAVLAIFVIRWVTKMVASIRAIERLPGPAFKFPQG